MSESLVNILHVDDNEANRYVVTRVLRNAGFAVTEAGTGTAGLAAIDQQQPDLVILDVQLPDISGFEVCQRIKSNPDTAFIPVLHLSASFIDSQDKVQGLNSGADGYLVQPVEPIELIATVNSLLRVRRAEESALALAQEWQITFDSIRDGVALLDQSGRFQRCNRAMEQLLGKAAHELLGSQHQAIMRSLLDGSALNPFERVQQTQHRESFEAESGGRWFLVTVDPVVNEQGVFTGAVYILADVSDRKQTEIALQVSEERLRLLLENATDYAIFFTDPQGHIIRWNRGAEAMLGYQEAEILGEPAACIFTPEDLERGADQLELQQAVDKGRGEDERWHVRKDGSRFWGSGIMTPLWDESGQLRGFAKILRNFTERKRAEDERNELLAREQEARGTAEAANRMKDEFLATLSHELRSPLNAMLGWIRLLNTRKFDATTTARAMETIERNAKAQAQLIEDLLDVSRIIQGKLRLNVRPIELIPVIEAAIETVQPAAEAKEIHLNSVLDPTTGTVAGDSDRLQQVIWNLLSNAIKFTPKGGRVQVMLQRVNSHVEIIITDTGQGIDSEFVPYVFERFRQADSSITRSYSGLGLGLAIVRHLVELHGGTVHADSQGEGQGSTFTVRLPLIPVRFSSYSGNQVHPAVDQGVTFNIPPDELAGVRVLVVDDEADARDFLKAVLEVCGAEVTTVAVAADAIAVIAQAKTDVLVSDIGMPQEDGYSLIRRVRLLPAAQGGNTPAVALTAYARSEDRLRAIAEGFQMHIPKPVEPAELVTVIASLAKKRRVGSQE